MKYKVGDYVGIYYGNHQGELTRAKVEAIITIPGWVNDHYVLSVEIPGGMDDDLVVRGDILGVRDPPPEGPVMREFEFKARVVLEGVTVLIDAYTEEEARAQAQSGGWEIADLDYETAELKDWEIR